MPVNSHTSLATSPPAEIAGRSRPPLQLFTDGVCDEGGGMPEHSAPESIEDVYVLIAVNVPHPRPGRTSIGIG